MRCFCAIVGVYETESCSGKIHGRRDGCSPDSRAPPMGALRDNVTDVERHRVSRSKDKYTSEQL